MANLHWVGVGADERDAFLGRGGTGVLSFSTSAGEPPFLVPASYGYDATHERFYFRLAVGSGAGEADYLDRPVAFATHDRTDDGWHSVVATGRLRAIDSEEYDSSVAQGLWAVDIPAVDIFEDPIDDVTFGQFSLDPERFTARREVESRD